MFIKGIDISKQALFERKKISTQPSWRDRQILMMQCVLSCMLILYGKY
jgi:hypothetical protein